MTARTHGGRSGEEVLALLRGWGGHRLQAVRFRRNRRTIWSLTQRGTVLNLHEGYRGAPTDILQHFAVIVAEAAAPTWRYREAADAVRRWTGLRPALDRAREESRARGAPALDPWRRTPGPCTGTPGQRRYLAALYEHMNEERFSGRLPGSLSLRLSHRMRSRLGHMVPGFVPGTRTPRVVEIALNADLLLAANAAVRVDTLLHEMAHAAEWLFEGRTGHGPGWRRWARIAGCRERACTGEAIHRRPRGESRVTRVPPLDEGIPAVG